MPETLTDRNRCHKCDKTGRRKKDKLSTCGRCQAITYCSRVCQAEDWPRHKANCVPVMIAEVGEKGRGLVAAKDIKIGEEILLDNTVITLEIPESKDYLSVITPTIARLLREQVQALPEEKLTQFYNIKTVDNNVTSSERNLKIARRENCLRELKIFQSNRVEDNKKKVFAFVLSLINHSCAPNADYHLKPDESKEEKKVEETYELRAIKDIPKGEEISIFYLKYYYGAIPSLLRQSKIMDIYGFDCKCNVCCGNVDDQYDLLLKLAKLGLEIGNFPDASKHLTSDEWDNLAIKEGIVLNLSKDLYIGKVRTKTVACFRAARAAQISRNPVLLEKAMNAWKELVMKTGFEGKISDYKEMEEMVVKWSPELNSKKPPTKEEIDSFESLTVW